MDFYDRKLKAFALIKKMVEVGNFTKQEIGIVVVEELGLATKTTVGYINQKIEDGFWEMNELGIMKKREAKSEDS